MSISRTALALAVVAVPWAAHAQGVTLPNGIFFPDGWPVVSTTGLGDEGMGVMGHRPDPNDGGATHLFLYTGTNPGAEGTIEISLIGDLPQGMRPICVGTTAWTMPDYQNGYHIPEWPALSIVDIAAYNLVTNTVTVRWTTLGNLKDNSNYSLNVICPPKTADHAR